MAEVKQLQITLPNGREIKGNLVTAFQSGDKNFLISYLDDPIVSQPEGMNNLSVSLLSGTTIVGIEKNDAATWDPLRDHMRGIITGSSYPTNYINDVPSTISASNELYARHIAVSPEQKDVLANDYIAKTTTMAVAEPVAPAVEEAPAVPSAESTPTVSNPQPAVASEPAPVMPTTETPAVAPVVEEPAPTVPSVESTPTVSNPQPTVASEPAPAMPTTETPTVAPVVEEPAPTVPSMESTSTISNPQPAVASELTPAMPTTETPAVAPMVEEPASVMPSIFDSAPVIEPQTTIEPQAPVTPAMPETPVTTASVAESKVENTPSLDLSQMKEAFMNSVSQLFDQTFAELGNQQIRMAQMEQELNAKLADANQLLAAAEEAKKDAEAKAAVATVAFNNAQNLQPQQPAVVDIPTVVLPTPDAPVLTKTPA